jgi:hypothetical protein
VLELVGRNSTFRKRCNAQAEEMRRLGGSDGTVLGKSCYGQ